MTSGPNPELIYDYYGALSCAGLVLLRMWACQQHETVPLRTPVLPLNCYSSPTSAPYFQASPRRATSSSTPPPAAPSWQTRWPPCSRARAWSAARTPSAALTTVSRVVCARLAGCCCGVTLLPMPQRCRVPACQTGGCMWYESSTGHAVPANGVLICFFFPSPFSRYLHPAHAHVAGGRHPGGAAVHGRIAGPAGTAVAWVGC